MTSNMESGMFWRFKQKKLFFGQILSKNFIFWWTSFINIPFVLALIFYKFSDFFLVKCANRNKSHFGTRIVTHKVRENNLHAKILDREFRLSVNSLIGLTPFEIKKRNWIVKKKSRDLCMIYDNLNIVDDFTF